MYVAAAVGDQPDRIAVLAANHPPLAMLRRQEVDEVTARLEGIGVEGELGAVGPALYGCWIGVKR